jgi:thiamine-phosphate pyrophosphorylase
VITEEYCAGRSALDIAGRAISGGVDIIQMREKHMPRRELIALGKRLAKLCKDKGVTFIVNDDPMLAKEVDSDGVHLGQDDIGRFSITTARDIVGPGRIIGVSTDSIVQFEKTNSEDADYIAVGPIFSTTVKSYCIGTGCIKAVLASARRPVFFIGGINFSTLPAAFAEGAKNIALIKGITEADDIESAARRFKDELNKQKKISTHE